MFTITCRARKWDSNGIEDIEHKLFAKLELIESKIPRKQQTVHLKRNFISSFVQQKAKSIMTNWCDYILEMYVYLTASRTKCQYDAMFIGLNLYSDETCIDTCQN